MNIKLNKNSKEKINCNIDIPKSDINDKQFNMFLDTLTNSNYLVRINQKTGLEWKEVLVKMRYSKQAEYLNLDTVLVDYNRGSRAVSSAIHESFHLMLRQINWTENSIVKDILLKYPQLNSSPRGNGYKMEQMFAYLLQNEIYQEIAKDLNFDASNEYWSMEYIKNTHVPHEFDTPFLKQLALSIIEVWDKPNKSNDIFELIKKSFESKYLIRYK